MSGRRPMSAAQKDPMYRQHGFYGEEPARHWASNS